MAALGAIAGLIGTGLQVMGTIQSGQAQKAAANLEAKEREKAAAEERAAGQREAMEKRNEGDRVASAQQAIAAKSGAGFGPSILDIYGDTAARVQFNEDTAMYGAESRARGQIDQANAARAKGKAAATGSIFEGLGAGFGGLSKLYG